jgi:hypothetical protein
MEERFDELFPFGLEEPEDGYDKTRKIKNFIHSEIALALQQRDAELREKIEKMDGLYDTFSEDDDSILWKSMRYAHRKVIADVLALLTPTS